jgi:hypothetical protein
VLWAEIVLNGTEIAFEVFVKILKLGIGCCP